MQSCETKSQQTYLQCSLSDYCGMGGGKRKKNEEIWCEIVSLSCVREVILYKHDLSKDDTNRQTNMDEGKFITRQRSTGN